MHKFMGFRRKFHWQIVAATILVAGSTTIARDSLKAEPTEKIGNEVSLQIASVLATPGTTLAFTITNNGKTNVGIEGPMGDPSRLVIIKPNGKETEQYAIGDAPDRPASVVKPSESKTWKIDVSDMFIMTSVYKESGVYRIYWKYRQRQPDGTLIVYKSNEFLLLREKGTPVIDPATGRPEPQQ